MLGIETSEKLALDSAVRMVVEEMSITDFLIAIGMEWKRMLLTSIIIMG